MNLATNASTFVEFNKVPEQSSLAVGEVIYKTSPVPSFTYFAADGISKALINITTSLESNNEFSLRLVNSYKTPVNNIVTTLAGSVWGSSDGLGPAAQFTSPRAVALDAIGNVIVADGSHRIRKITTGGMVSTLAGSTAGFLDATGAGALFSSPRGVAVDANDNVIVADTFNHRIRKVTPGGVVTTLAGSTQGFSDATGASAQFSSPTGVAVDAIGNVIVADSVNNRIRKITTGGVVTTLAGSAAVGFLDATGASARFSYPTGVAVDAAGNIYVADSGNKRIRKITTGGVVTTLAGSGVSGWADGPGTAAQFYSPHGVAVDAIGNVFVADSGNHLIRKVTTGGAVTTLAGQIPQSGQSTWGFLDGAGTSAKFTSPYGVAVDAIGNVIVADSDNVRIRKVTTSSLISTARQWITSTKNNTGKYTINTKFSFIVNHADVFGIQMYTTTQSSTDGSILLEKVSVIQGGGGRLVSIPLIPKLYKRSSIKLRKGSDITTNNNRPLQQTLPNPKIYKRRSAKRSKNFKSTAKKGYRGVPK
jgi:sugar lactone lactonase YvrE